MLKNKKMRFLPKILFMVLLMVVFLTGFRKNEKQVLLQDELMTAEQVNYETVQVQIGDCEKETSGDATIFYVMNRKLYWENSKAYFKEVRVKKGQEVKAGDILMVFETEENLFEQESLKLKLTRTQEDKEEQNAEKLAELNAEKNKMKQLQGYELQIAELKLEKMQAAYEQFLYQKEKEIVQLQEQIKAINKAAEKNVITAPFDGVISEVTRLNEGDQVTAGQYLISLYSTDKLLFKADDSMGKLRYNMDVTIEIGKNDDLKSYNGKVIVAPNILPLSASKKQTLIELSEELPIDQLDENIKYRGITEGAYNILRVEQKAIRREGDKEFVYLLEGDLIQKRYIKTALYTMEAVWVLDGLNEGQTLIVD